MFFILFLLQKDGQKGSTLELEEIYHKYLETWYDKKLFILMCLVIYTHTRMHSQELV